MSGYRRSFPKGTSERMCALMSEARNISELKRAQCIYFRSEHGLPPQQIADMVGFDVGTVRNLHSAFLRDGEAALKLSGKGGRYHAYLTEEEEASWLEGFRDAGENGGILEVGRIQAAFEEKVGRKVAKSTVYDLLHRHGWRKITPRPRHPKSDPDAAASFKKNFRDIVAEAKAEADARELPLRVMFQDEARFGRINDPKRCWSPKRTRPTVGKQIIREYTYAYGAVSPRDGAADFLILPVMTAVAMKVFLDELARRHDGQYILMIYDGAPCHSPGALNIPDTMTVRTLPPYSPQLNPVENIWDDMREKFFANIVFESMDAVENKISEACLHYEEHVTTQV